jgi:glycerophosphoryl diester phosphodiesterase
MAAFRAAEAAGVDYIEADVQRSADGVLVVIHDETLERTTDGHGPVAGVDARDLVELDAGSWFSPDHRGERIPTLEAVLAWLDGQPGLAAILEAKTAGVGAELAERLAATSLRERLAICSFLPEELIAAKEAEESVPCVLICPRHPPEPDLVEQVLDSRADGANVSWQWLEPPLIEQLRGAGLVVAGGTANEDRTVETLSGLGVDFVDSDRPRAAVAARDRARGVDRPKHRPASLGSPGVRVGQ